MKRLAPIFSLIASALFAGCSAPNSSRLLPISNAGTQALRTGQRVTPSLAAAHLYVLQSLPTSSFGQLSNLEQLPAMDDPRISIYATNAPFQNLRSIGDDVFGPSAVATDGSGTLYVAFEASNLPGATGGAVEVFKPGSKTPTRIIAGPATGLSAPQSIAVGGGHIYVGNAFNGSLPASQTPYLGSVTVYSQNATGNARPLTSLAGQHTGIGDPIGLLTDADGDVYVLSQNGFPLPKQTSIGGMLLEFQANQHGDAAPTAYGSATGSGYPAAAPTATALAWYGADVAVLAGGGSLGAPCTSKSGDYIAVFGAGPGVSQAPVQCYPVGATGHGFSPCGNGFWVGTAPVNSKTGGRTGVLAEFATNGTQIAAIRGPATGIDEVGAVACTAGSPVAANLTTGTIETFAGVKNGNAAPSATIDTNPVHLYAPTGIAVEANGTIVVSDAGTPYGAIAPRVSIFAPNASGDQPPQRVITSSAFVRWNASGGWPTQAVAVDSTSNVYVAQIPYFGSFPATVTVFAAKASTNAKPTRTIALPTKTVNGIAEATVGYGLAVDAKNNLYVSGPNLIDVYAAGKTTPHRAISVSDYAGALGGSAIDAAGDIAVAVGNASTSGNAIKVIPATGAGRTIAGSSTGLDNATQAAFTSLGSLFIADGYAAADTIGITTILSFAKDAQGNVSPTSRFSQPGQVTGLVVGP